jgi:starch-binding outer membrane protein, SusD/RagB family
MKLRYMLFASAVSLMAAGCNESSFLDNPAQGVISDEVIENTGQVDLLTNAAYAGLMGADDVQGSANAYPTTNWSYGSVRADDAYKGGGGTGDLSDVHKI